MGQTFLMSIGTERAMNQARQPHPGANVRSSWLRHRPVCVLLGLLVGFSVAALGWRLSIDYRDHLLSREITRVRAELDTFANSLTSVVSRQQAVASATAAFVTVHSEEPGFRRAFELYAAGLQADNEVIRGILLFPKAGTVLVHPPAGNEAVQGRTLQDLINDERPEVRADVGRALASRRIALSVPYMLRQGSVGFVVRHAAYRNEEFLGLVAVVLQMDRLLDTAGLQLAARELRIGFRDHRGADFWGDADVFNAAVVLSKVTLAEGSWTIAAEPRAGWLSDVGPQIAAIRITSLLAALLAGATAYAVAARQAALRRSLEARTEELGRSEKNYRALFEQAETARAATDGERREIGQTLERLHEGFSMVDRDWTYTYVNPALAKLVGRRAEEMVGRRIWDVLPEAVGTAVDTAAHRAMTEQKPIELEHYFPPLGRWFHQRFFPTPQGLSVFTNDITEWRRAQDALRASEEHLRELLRKVPLPLRFSDATGRIVFLNDSFVRMFGYTHEEIPDLKTWWEKAYPEPDSRDQAMRRWTAAVARGGPDGSIVAGEFRVMCRHGMARVVEISGRIMSGGVLAVLADVTERREAEEQTKSAQLETARLLEVAEQSRAVLLSLVEDQKAAEAALRESQERLRLHAAALEAAANAIVITDPQGNIEWANHAFEALSGWTLAEAQGRNPRTLVRSGRQDAAFYREMWSTLSAGKVWRGEVVNRRKDGALRTEDMTITPIRDERGEIRHFIAIKQDITEHKTMETQFLHAQRMEALGTLAGGIAHDLNNILSPMMMVTGLLKHKLAAESDQVLLEMLQSGAVRGAGIVKQLLTFSRGQEGERAVVQPKHLVKEISSMMRETFPREIDLRQDVQAGLWTVLADPTQLHQVLLNLCVNARDAMPSGGCLTMAAANVSIESGSKVLPPGFNPGPYVAVSVKDTGHGIPPEAIHRIFDPFFTTKPFGKGTGLGLSTVLGIVRNHQGFVTVDSAPGNGSTFTVYLPATPESADVAPLTPAVLPAPAESGETILVVDDERDIRDASRALLEQQNYRVLTAGNGEEGLSQFLANRSDIKLVFTDVMMPVMNGVDLVRALRVIDPTIRVIATSGLGETTRGTELAELQVIEVIPKPYDGPTLLAAVHHALAG